MIAEDIQGTVLDALSLVTMPRHLFQSKKLNDLSIYGQLLSDICRGIALKGLSNFCEICNCQNQQRL